jgi:repressor LexA
MGKLTLALVKSSLADFYLRRRRMPSYAEMMNLLGVRSKSVVHYWVEKLLEGGLLRRDEGGHLLPCHQTMALPLAGEVQAGFPSPAEEELRDLISLDEYLINRPQASFLLRVTGDSMVGAGIREGDLVIVERGREPQHGDIVLAEVDGSWTMKFFHRRGGEISLASANPRFPPFKPREELRLGGVVVASIRKYHR